MTKKKEPSQPGAAKGRKPVDLNETSDAKFKRLTEARVIRALTAIRLLKNLSRLKPSEAQREAVFGALEEAMETAYTAWKNEPKSRVTFALPEAVEVKPDAIK
jgi:hypothetical protein